MLDAVTDPENHTVVLMTSAQVGKTEVINNIVGYHIHQSPCPILVVQPTLEMGQTWSKDRLAPMLRDTPVLKGKVKDPRSRDANNTQMHKTFPGGHISICGANSPSSLASRPILLLLVDECDRAPASAGTEGDPINLAKKRTRTFWNRKIVLVSTPTIQGSSRIEKAFEESDQRHYYVPCPDCGEFQRLYWKNVVWPEENPALALYHCSECGSGWHDAARWGSIRHGKWVSENPDGFAGVAGFHINELYSPWARLSDIVEAFISAKRSPEMLKTWVNTSLGETWAERGEAPDWKRLYDRREHYPINTLPSRDIVMITAGADVQGGQSPRIELEVVAWGENFESWSIDYRVFYGDTSDLNGDCWKKLDEILSEKWETKGGLPLQIEALAIDAGFNTQTVYNWCRKYQNNRVFAVMGDDKLKSLVSLPKVVDVQLKGKRIARGTKRAYVGVSVAKQELYGWLRQSMGEDEESPYGYCHFPEYDEEFFKQLTAEQLVKRYHKGYQKFSWEKTRDRNEALDCRVYARGVACLAGLDRMSARQFKELRDLYDPPPKKVKPAPSKAATVSGRDSEEMQYQARRKRERKKSDYWR